ncbi:hypothetical protein EDB19DRAFT_292049 [Suillus lakei]|nr:hypothetical protein EDB19DRAFT_292049 [Suillus lakei]
MVQIESPIFLKRIPFIILLGSSPASSTSGRAQLPVILAILEYVGNYAPIADLFRTSRMIRHHNSPFRQPISPNYYGCGRTRWIYHSQMIRNNGTFIDNRTRLSINRSESIVEVKRIADMTPFQGPNLNKVEFCPPSHRG